MSALVTSLFHQNDAFTKFLSKYVLIFCYFHNVTFRGSAIATFYLPKSQLSSSTVVLYWSRAKKKSTFEIRESKCFVKPSAQFQCKMIYLTMWIVLEPYSLVFIFTCVHLKLRKSSIIYVFLYFSQALEMIFHSHKVEIFFACEFCFCNVMARMKCQSHFWKA